MAQITKVEYDSWMDKMCEQLGEDPRFVTRIVIDAKSGDFVRIYIERIAMEGDLVVELPDDPGVKITVIG